MKDYLVRHALSNVWCTPYQDRQAMIKLRPLTIHGGARKSFSYLRRDFYLPTSNQYYHVYALGQNNSTRLNLPVDQPEKWLKFKDVCTSQSLLAEFYSTTGLQFCRDMIYLMYTKQNYFLIAVRRQDKIANLDEIDLFVRFQSNSFFQSVRDDSNPANIEMDGLEVTQQNAASVVGFQFQYHTRRDSAVGHAYAFHNGRYVNDFLPTNVKPGDIIEWVYDTSVKEVHDIFLDEAGSYMSDLDDLRKYLVHLPKSLDGIDYRDDLDIYILQFSSTGLSYDGVYYHKNLENSVRMVTHRDYGIPESYIQTYLGNNPQWSDRQFTAMRIHVKNSGYARPLIDEHSRIREFYNRFDDDGILDVMVGEDAVLTEWQAVELEKSMYTKIMRSNANQVTASTVALAYGYNAMAKITADTPSMLVNGSVALPAGLQLNSTVFEYDVNGLLLGFRHHVDGVNYYPQNNNCVMVEAISGEGDLDPGLVYGNTAVPLDVTQSYRFYICPIVNGAPTGVWQDVTADTEVVSIVAGSAVWNLTPDFLGCVKGNANFTCYSLDVESDDYTYKFTINQEYIGNPLYIPGGKLDLFLNGRALIKDIDYYLKWPQVHIVTKKYLVPGNIQRVTVRSTGFCLSDMSIPVTGEIGFVDHGYVSVDNEYDVREDKVIRCVVAGKTYHRSQIDFEEDRRLLTVPRLVNGSPYSIENVDPPVREIFDYDTFPLQARSRDLDARVSAYLSANLPPIVHEGPNVIPELYPLFSPVVARLMWEMKLGILEPVPADATEMELAALMANYMDYFEYDPAYKEQDLNYVVIHPHPFTDPVTISQPAYSFLERVIRLYLHSSIDMTPYVNIEVGG